MDEHSLQQWQAKLEELAGKNRTLASDYVAMAKLCSEARDAARSLHNCMFDGEVAYERRIRRWPWLKEE